MTVGTTGPVMAASGSGTVAYATDTGQGHSLAGAGTSNDTAYDPAMAGGDDYGYTPVQPMAAMDDYGDQLLALTSGDGRLKLTFKDGGGNGLEMKTYLDGQELSTQYLKEGTREFELDGRTVKLEVNHYNRWIFNDHHEVNVTITDANGAQVAKDGVDDGNSNQRHEGVLGDDALVSMVQQLTGHDVSGQMGTRLIDGFLLPSQEQRDRQGSSVFLGDFGVGFIEFGAEVPDEGNWPAIDLQIQTTNDEGVEQIAHLGGSLPATGSVSFAQENGFQTTLSWRFRQDGDRWVLDGVDVRSTGTDANGQPVERAWSASPSGSDLQATFSELGMSKNDYVAFGRALLATPGFQQYEQQGG